MLNKMVIAVDSEFADQKLTKLSEPIEFFGIEGSTSDGCSEVKLIREMLLEYEILGISPGHGHGINVLEEISRSETKPYIEKLSNPDYRYYMNRCKEIEAVHYFDESMEFDRVYDILNENVLNYRN